MSMVKDHAEAMSIVRWAFSTYWATSDWTPEQRASLAASLVGKDKFDAKTAIESHWRSSGWKNPRSVAAILDLISRLRQERDPEQQAATAPVNDPPDTVYVIGGFGAISEAMKAKWRGDADGVGRAFERVRLRRVSGGERALKREEIDDLADRIKNRR